MASIRRAQNDASDPHDKRKARGAFFTPPEMSRFIARWAVRSLGDVVMEPSCGEASFLLAAGAELVQRGAPLAELGSHLHGIELHAPSAQSATALLASEGMRSSIYVSDFFDVEATPRYDAVIGNPPYVRYQDFKGEARAKSAEAALKQGVRLTGLASSWAAFTVYSAEFLRPSGRLGLVLPAELLAVNYASDVRRFLLRRFAKVRLVMFEELVFPGVLEEVVLLLAEGEGPAPHFEVFQARDLTDLEGLSDAADQLWTGFTPEADDKWTPALLGKGALAAYRKLAAGEGFAPMVEWGDTYLGAVTGNNRYFTLTKARAKELGLRAKELRRISPPGSRHLRGLSLTQHYWQVLADEGAPCFLFYPGDKPSAAAQAYIAAGEKAGVHTAYKCRMRNPWWRVPMVETADLLLTYMDHDRPRLTTNHARVDHLNSLYGVSLYPEHRQLGRDLIPIASLNSVTLLGSEVVGRAYGGGLLKLEPREADFLPLPSLELVSAAADELRALRDQLALALRRGDLMDAVRLVDQVLLVRHLGVSHADLSHLRDARDLMFSRRVTRGKGIRASS